MTQVHNKVNAGIMDAVTCGGMCEAAEPEDEEYEIGMEEDGLEPYGHVNEASDCIPYYNLTLNTDNAYPFITFTKKDGTDTETFVGEPGEEHNAMPAKLLSDKKINKEDFGSLWDIKRDEYRSGRIWFLENGRIFVSFYSYKRSNYSAMYKDVVETLLQVKEKLGLNFNIGKVIIDFWTFINGDDNIFVPVRWLNNGIADAYFKYMIECVPVGEDSFKLKTARGNFVLDWEGNGTESINENKGKKTIYITEGQMRVMQTLLENEGTNLKKARNFLKSKGYEENERQQILDAIRHDIPNSRVAECKFMLGITRMYLSGQLRDGRNVNDLNKILKYIAMDAHVNEYDYNLNGENLDTLVTRFSGIAANDLKQSIENSNARNLTVNQEYTIVPIDTPEEAQKYGDYVDWCVTQDEGAYNSYTNEGLGRFYFCLRNGFKKVKRVPGPGCPLDDYGLSMIAVSVRDDGSVNTITCRWNHDEGGNDNVMEPEQLENIIGRNFYQTFKPYTREELRAKGFIPFDEAAEELASGKKPEEIFKATQPFGNGLLLVALNSKTNIVRQVNENGQMRYEFLSDKWFDNTSVDNDGGFEYVVVTFDYDNPDKARTNYVGPNGNFLLDTWVTYGNFFTNGYALIQAQNGGKTYVNFIDRNGNYKLKDWIETGGNPEPQSPYIRYVEDAGKDGYSVIARNIGWDDDGFEKLEKNLLSIENNGALLFNRWHNEIHQIDSWFEWDGKRTYGYIVSDMAKDGSRVYNIGLPDGTLIFEHGLYGLNIINRAFYGHSILVLKITKGSTYKLFSTLSKEFSDWYDDVKFGKVGNSRFNMVTCGAEDDYVAKGFFKDPPQFLPLLVRKGGSIYYLDKSLRPICDEALSYGEPFMWCSDDDARPEYRLGIVKVASGEKYNFMRVDGTFLSNIWFASVGRDWAYDESWASWRNDEDKGKLRILVKPNEEDKKWYKLYEDGELVEFNPNGMMTDSDYRTIHGYMYESTNHRNKEMNFDYQKYIKSFVQFLRSQHLSIDPLPEIELKNDEQDGLFIKTGYYDPDAMKVVAYVNDRHPKDVMRTIAHEFVHHMQNVQDPNKDWGSNGDLEQDRKLRGIEGEAFLLGNILFREWTEYARKNERNLNESKKRKKQVRNDEGELVPETCDKCGGKVVCQIHGEPVYICKECGKYFGTMPFPGNLDEITSELVEPDDVDLSSFNIKKHLNPKFWDGGHLDTRIRLKLLDIADDFFDSLGVDWVEPEDVIITGSLANYNWNDKYSDIDLHILVDYEDVDERVDFVREYFTLKKNEWNEKHKGLRIFGFPVEVYVQDANEPHASSGVYSVDRDEWITEPDKNKIRSGKVDKKHIREMVSTYMNKIDALIDIYKHHKDDEYEMRKVAEDAKEMFDEIKTLRKNDLAKYGREMCDGNIIFKALRRSDYIGKLIRLRDLTYDKINSL